MRLDDYVAVSNTNIRLRADLGRTARVLVPNPPEWRWMRSGDASPWFPGSVYRQPASRDWTAPLRRLREDLSLYESCRYAAFCSGVTSRSMRFRDPRSATSRS